MDHTHRCHTSRSHSQLREATQSCTFHQGANTIIDQVRGIMHMYDYWFDIQKFISGNHDDRVARKTGGQVYLEMLLDDTPTEFSTYCYMYVFMPSVQEWVYVCHQYNYSKNSQNLARQIYNVESAPDGYDNETGDLVPGHNYDLDPPNKQKCHVVIGHTHQQQEGWTEDGNYRAVGTGFNPAPRTVLRCLSPPALQNGDDALSSQNARYRGVIRTLDTKLYFAPECPQWAAQSATDIPVQE